VGGFGKRPTKSGGDRLEKRGRKKKGELKVTHSRRGVSHSLVGSRGTKARRLGLWQSKSERSKGGKPGGQFDAKTKEPTEIRGMATGVCKRSRKRKVNLDGGGGGKPGVVNAVPRDYLGEVGFHQEKSGHWVTAAGKAKTAKG